MALEQEGFLPMRGTFRDHLILLLLCNALLLMLGGWARQTRASRLCSRCGHLLGHACRRLACRCKEQPPESEVARLMQDRLLDFRVDSVRMTINIISIISLNCTLAAIHAIVTGFDGFISQELMALHSCVQAYLALVALRPGLVTKKTLDFHFAILVLYFAACVSPLANPGVLFQVGVNVVVMGLNLARGTTGCAALFTFCNFCFIACSAASFWRSASHHCFTSAQPDWFWPSVEVLCMSAFCVMASVLDGSQKASLMNQLELYEVRELHNAASALLRSICDVVVELDDDRRIVSPGPDLGSYLMRGTSLQGCLLDDLIKDDEDRQRLRERLAGPKRVEEGLAETMPVSFKDGWGNAVRVELLWFRFGRAQHIMVGIREFGEAAHPPGRPGAADDTFPAPDAPPAVASDAAEQSSVVVAGDVVMIVDCSQEGYPIQHLNRGFCTQIGRLPLDSPVLSHISKPRNFLIWVQDSLNVLFHGGETELHRVTFRMPQGRVTTSCSMAPIGEGGFDMKRIVLSFTLRLRGSSEGSQGSASGRGTPRVPPSGMSL